jgi:hypothetical protein
MAVVNIRVRTPLFIAIDVPVIVFYHIVATFYTPVAQNLQSLEGTFGWLIGQLVDCFALRCFALFWLGWFVSLHN